MREWNCSDKGQMISQNECINYQRSYKLMNSQNKESNSRIPQMRRLLTQYLIEELLVKFVLNTGLKQSQQYRLIYLLKIAQYYFFDRLNLFSHKDTTICNQEEIFFISKLNEYLPDYLRMENHIIKNLLQSFGKIPVKGAIISRKGIVEREFLLVQDRRTDKYGFCKGKIAEGESSYECVRRQVLEEIGLRISSFGRSISIIIHEISYQLIEAQLEKGSCTNQIIFQGDNYNSEIKQLVWWSQSKLKAICSWSKEQKEKVNHPTRTAFKIWLNMRNN